MTLPFVSFALRRWRRRRIRGAMRGYRALRDSGRRNVLSAVMASLTTTPIGVQPSAWLVGAASARGELAVRQYLLIRVMGSIGLNASILHAIGTRTRVVHPLPRQWRSVVRSHGFPLSGPRSAIAWWIYVFLLWGYGAVTIARQLDASIRESFRRRWPQLGRYAFFVALTPGNVPQPASDGRSHDVITWYAQSEARMPSLTALAHSAGNASPASAGGLPVVPAASALPPLTGWDALRFAGWAAAAIVWSFADMWRGRWWHAVLLSEASAAAVARLQRRHPLAAQYLFHASNVVYRPLWTYEAERRGSDIVLYFYSTNSEAFKLDDGYSTPLHSWQVMTWPRYLVWDEAQAAFLQRAIGPAGGIQIVGPIWFHSSATEMPPLPEGTIAVFDVQPQRASRRQMLGTPHEFYGDRVAVRFVRDIHAVASAQGRAIAFKRKRHIGPMLHKGYASVVERLSGSPLFVTVDPGISAVRVIERSAAVVSMPFTSTALVARQAGKPSIYYDPVGFIQKDDRAAHGIPVITGRAELEAWLERVTAS